MDQGSSLYIMSSLAHQQYTLAVGSFRHYENTPIQKIRKISPQKSVNFQKKIRIFVYISAQNIDCEYSLEPPRRGGSNEYPQSMFLSRI